MTGKPRDIVAEFDITTICLIFAKSSYVRWIAQHESVEPAQTENPYYGLE